MGDEVRGEAFQATSLHTPCGVETPRAEVSTTRGWDCWFLDIKYLLIKNSLIRKDGERNDGKREDGKGWDEGGRDEGGEDGE